MKAFNKLIEYCFALLTLSTATISTIQPNYSQHVVHSAASIKNILLENFNKFSHDNKSSSGSLELFSAPKGQHDRMEGAQRIQKYQTPVEVRSSSPHLPVASLSKRSAIAKPPHKDTQNSKNDCELREENPENGETAIRNARIKYYKAFRKAHNNVKHKSDANEKLIVLPDSNGTAIIVRKDSDDEDRQLRNERRSSPTSSLTDRRAFGVEASGYQYPLQQHISHGPPGIIPSGVVAAGAETFNGHLPAGRTSVEGPRVISTISQYSTEKSARVGQANAASSPSPASAYSLMNPYRNIANYVQNSFEAQPTQLLSEFAPSPRSRFSNAEIVSAERGLSSRDSFNENNEAIDFDAIRQPVRSEGSCYPPGSLCNREGLLMDAPSAMIRTQQRCNSMRLREIIISNIIEGDAESSKRAIQLVAEQELGGFYNVICGSGFFSYIAHADEFCLTAIGRVNCYVFSPICFQDINMDIMKKRRKAARRKSFLNMN